MEKILIIDKKIGTVDFISTGDLQFIRHKISNRKIFIYSYRKNSPLKNIYYTTTTHVWYDL